MSDKLHFVATGLFSPQIFAGLRRFQLGYEGQTQIGVNLRKSAAKIVLVTTS